MTLDIGVARDDGDVESFARLADEVFFGGRSSFRMRYPAAFSSGNSENLLVARDGARVVAGVASYRARLRLAPTLVLETAAIGAVCTAPDHRGSGISTQLLEMTRGRAIEEGVHLLLISGTGPLYQRLGGREVGALDELHARLDELPVGAGTYHRHERPEAALVDECWAAYEREAVRFERTPDEFAILLAGHLHPFENETAALLTSSQVNGYAIVRTGMEGSERVGFLVEHAGDVDHWLSIAVAEARQQGCARFFTRLPAAPRSWHGRVEPTPMTGVIAIADAAAAFALIVDHLNQQAGVQRWEIDARSDGLTLREGGRDVVTGDNGDPLRFLWGGPDREPAPWRLPSFRPDGLNFL